MNEEKKNWIIDSPMFKVGLLVLSIDMFLRLCAAQFLLDFSDSFGGDFYIIFLPLITGMFSTAAIIFSTKVLSKVVQKIKSCAIAFVAFGAAVSLVSIFFIIYEFCIFGFASGNFIMWLIRIAVIISAFLLVTGVLKAKIIDADTVGTNQKEASLLRWLAGNKKMEQASSSDASTENDGNLE